MKKRTLTHQGKREKAWKERKLYAVKYYPRKRLYYAIKLKNCHEKEVKEMNEEIAFVYRS
jgi:hypothetical protein